MVATANHILLPLGACMMAGSGMGCHTREAKEAAAVANALQPGPWRYVQHFVQALQDAAYSAGLECEGIEAALPEVARGSYQPASGVITANGGMAEADDDVLEDVSSIQETLSYLLALLLRAMAAAAQQVVSQRGAPRIRLH